MKDYLLVFTEGADLYNLEKQLKHFPESTVVKAPLKEDYYTLEACINEALQNGYDSFHWITMREDWAELDSELKKEIKGFKEVGVIPAIYGRLREADTVPQTQGQTQNTQQPIGNIVVFPYNLVSFQAGSWKPNFEAIKSIPTQNSFGFVPLSDKALYGNAVDSHDLNCDEAFTLALELAKATDPAAKNIIQSIFKPSDGGDGESFVSNKGSLNSQERLNVKEAINFQHINPNDMDWAADDKRRDARTNKGKNKAVLKSDKWAEITSRYGIDVTALNSASPRIIIPCYANIQDHLDGKFRDPNTNQNQNQDAIDWYNEHINFIAGNGTEDRILLFIQKELEKLRIKRSATDYIVKSRSIKVKSNNNDIVKNVLDDQTLRQKFQNYLNSVNKKEEVSSAPVSEGDPNFLSYLLNKAGRIQNGQVLPTQVYIEQDKCSEMTQQAQKFNNGKPKPVVSIVPIKVSSSLKRNEEFFRRYRQMKNQLDNLKPEQLTQYEDKDYDEIGPTGPLNEADNYIFQILQLNNYNITNNITNNTRISFDSHDYYNICVSNGWQSIGDFVKKALLADQFQDEFKDTWGEWAIKGTKKAAAYATNAGGYRDKKNQEKANMLAALTVDPSKIKRPETDPNWNNLSDEEKKKRLDAYQQKVARSQFLLNRQMKKTNDAMIADKNRNTAFNQQRNQLADETVKQTQIAQLDTVIKWANDQLDMNSRQEDDKRLPSEKRNLIFSTGQKALEFKKQLINSDKHDYTNKDRHSGTEFNFMNNDMYTQLLGTAEQLGCKGIPETAAKINKRQAYQGTSLDANSRKNQKLLQDQNAQKMENLKKNFYCMNGYKELRDSLTK